MDNKNNSYETLPEWLKNPWSFLLFGIFMGNLFSYLSALINGKEIRFFGCGELHSIFYLDSCHSVLPTTAFEFGLTAGWSLLFGFAALFVFFFMEKKKHHRVVIKKN